MTPEQTGTDNADVTFSPATLSFSTSNWDTAQSFTVSAASDEDAAGDSADIELTAAGAEFGSATGSVDVSVTDDDAELILSATALTVNEDDDATFTVKLKGRPSSTVTVTPEQTGTDNADVTFSPATLSFSTSNWDTAQSFTVSAASDEDAAGDSADIELTAAGAEFGSAAGSVDVSVTDDDAELILSATALRIDEGGTGEFTVKLKGRPAAGVTVTLVQPTNADVTLDTDTAMAGNQNTLAFTTGSWNTARTVTVTAGQDDDTAEDTADIELSAAGAEFGSAASSVDVSVTDDDVRLVLSASSLTIAEGGTGNFTVKLKGPPSATVTVTLETAVQHRCDARHQCGHIRQPEHAGVHHRQLGRRPDRHGDGGPGRRRRP